MNIGLLIVLSLLNVVTVMLHGLGCYLLISQYRFGLHTPQQLYLINLAVSEGTTNFLQLLINYEGKHLHNSTTIHTWQHYVKTMRGYGFVTVYFLTMIYLTLDKLLDIYLNIKYHLYWNEYRTKNLIVTTWIVTLSSAVTASIVYHFTGFDVHETLDLNIYPKFDVVFLIVAGTTYPLIFHKYKQSRAPPHLIRLITQSSMEEAVETFKVFKQSRFYIPLLLTVSFTMFMVIPEFVNFSQVVSGHKHCDDSVLMICLRILWTMSYLVDAIIYIWIRTSVRKLLKRKLRKRRRRISEAIRIMIDETIF